LGDFSPGWACLFSSPAQNNEAASLFLAKRLLQQINLTFLFLKKINLTFLFSKNQFDVSQKK